MEWGGDRRLPKQWLQDCLPKVCIWQRCSCNSIVSVKHMHRRPDNGPANIQRRNITEKCYRSFLGPPQMSHQFLCMCNLSYPICHHNAGSDSSENHLSRDHLTLHPICTEEESWGSGLFGLVLFRQNVKHHLTPIVWRCCSFTFECSLRKNTGKYITSLRWNCETILDKNFGFGLRATLSLQTAFIEVLPLTPAVHSLSLRWYSNKKSHLLAKKRQNRLSGHLMKATSTVR